MNAGHYKDIEYPFQFEDNGRFYIATNELSNGMVRTVEVAGCMDLLITAETVHVDFEYEEVLVIYDNWLNKEKQEARDHLRSY